MNSSPTNHGVVAVYTAGGAIGIGSLLFCFGFGGPLLYGSIIGVDQPQGPLLGIFCTGPLGICFGGLAGFFWGLHLTSEEPLPVRRNYRRAAIAMLVVSAGVPAFFLLMLILEHL